MNITEPVRQTARGAQQILQVDFLDKKAVR